MKIRTLAVAALLVVGAACGGGSDDQSAREMYDSYAAKYHDAMAEISLALGADPDTETFEEYVESGDACGKMTDEEREEAIGAVMVFLNPTLEKYGHSAIELLADVEKLNSAIRAEGYCNI